MVCGQQNQCDDHYVYRRWEMRALGLIITVFSIIEFGIGGAITNTFKASPFNTTSTYWTCAFFITAGTAAASSVNKGVVMVACIAASIGIIAGLSGSVTEAATASIFSRLLSCGVWHQYVIPPVVPFNTPGATNVDYFGAPRSYNSTRWCLYQTALAAPLEAPAYSPGSCYCSYYSQPVPQGQPSFADTCLVLEFSSGAPCNKIFTDFTPTLRASSSITALLTILSFCLSVTACVSLCCEVRVEELPVLPALIAPGPRGVQIVQVGMGPGGHTYPLPSDYAAGAAYADDGKIQQAFYIDANGAPIGLPPGSAAAAAAVAVGATSQTSASTSTPGGGGGGGGGGTWVHPGPTVVAYALPSVGPSSTHEPRTS